MTSCLPGRCNSRTVKLVDGTIGLVEATHEKMPDDDPRKTVLQPHDFYYNTTDLFQFCRPSSATCSRLAFNWLQYMYILTQKSLFLLIVASATWQ